MISEPLVSVIIPTVPSREKELRRAIASVENQTYENIQLIVVCDDTITSPAACNKGLKKARGKYVAFLGDDDIWYAEKLERQVEVMEHHSKCILCTTWSSDMRFGMWRTSKALPWVFYKDILKAFNYSSGSTYMIRNHPGIQFDEFLLCGQEYDFALRLLKYTKKYAYCVPEILVRQYSTFGQISTNWGKKIRGTWQLARKHGRDYTLFDWAKVLGLLGLYFTAFFLDVKIYKLITYMKEMYE